MEGKNWCVGNAGLLYTCPLWLQGHYKLIKINSYWSPLSYDHFPFYLFVFLLSFALIWSPAYSHPPASNLEKVEANTCLLQEKCSQPTKSAAHAVSRAVSP